MLRFDVVEHAKLAKALGVKDAPTLLIWEPGADKPTNHGSKLRGPNLAYWLKKLSPASAKQ